MNESRGAHNPLIRGRRGSCTKPIGSKEKSSSLLFIIRLSAHLQETMHLRAVEKVEERKGVDEQPSRPAEPEARPPPAVILPSELEIHQGHLHHVNHGNELLTFLISLHQCPCGSKPCVSPTTRRVRSLSRLMGKLHSVRSLRLTDRVTQPTKKSTVLTPTSTIVHRKHPASTCRSTEC